MSVARISSWVAMLIAALISATPSRAEPGPNVKSDTGVFIEWCEPTSIPLYRLVSFQLERDARTVEGIPSALRSGKVLSAVYRLGTFQRSTGTPEGYGLRLLVEPGLSSRASADRVEASA